MWEVLYYSVIIGIVAVPTVAVAQLIVARIRRKG